MILEDWDTRIATMIGDCGDQYLIKMRFEPQNWNINDQAAPSSTGWSQHHHTLTSIHHRDLQLDFLGVWFKWTHDTMSSVTSYRHTLIVNLITTCPIEYFFTNLIIDASDKNHNHYQLSSLVVRTMDWWYPDLLQFQECGVVCECDHCLTLSDLWLSLHFTLVYPVTSLLVILPTIIFISSSIIFLIPNFGKYILLMIPCSFQYCKIPSKSVS